MVVEPPQHIFECVGEGWGGGVVFQWAGWWSLGSQGIILMRCGLLR